MIRLMHAFVIAKLMASGVCVTLLNKSYSCTEVVHPFLCLQLRRGTDTGATLHLYLWRILSTGRESSLLCFLTL